MDYTLDAEPSGTNTDRERELIRTCSSLLAGFYFPAGLAHEKKNASVAATVTGHPPSTSATPHILIPAPGARAPPPAMCAAAGVGGGYRKLGLTGRGLSGVAERLSFKSGLQQEVAGSRLECSKESTVSGVRRALEVVRCMVLLFDLRLARTEPGPS